MNLRIKEMKDVNVQKIREIQAVLTKIAVKEHVFFNIVNYMNMGLVKEHGKRNDGSTNWVLTEKGERILNVVI